ncbi:hypothetical protein BKK56_03635 [Rodentibacter genomosp. 2]|uniref:hypothetical protein n=1 Tax=Rodentibacter genomosp. 2 TaxID=1908266 RepID=UPI0009856E69|nr:hypothetical protein BKK56_03635 [Rodentibacter genomosp. 2]
MADYILRVEGCNKTTNSCAPLDLKLSQEEVSKLQLATSSKGETVNYADYTEFWAVSFSITLSFWLLAVACGAVLRILRRG